MTARIPHILVAFITLFALSCGAAGDADRSPMRSKYNHALEDLERGDNEAAIDSFLEAIKQAGQDTEMRYRASFNLGLAYARQVDMDADLEQVPPADLEHSRDLLVKSTDWLRTAIHLKPDDDQARINLELVGRRMRAISDRINRGKNNLETRLDAAIEAERKLRDSIRDLTTLVHRSGNTAQPVEFQTEFENVATAQRTLITDVNEISDLAGEELGLLQDKGGKDGEALEDQEKVRLVQLTNLDVYLQRARTDLSDTRRSLRRLQGDRAHRQSDSGLRFLSRAREQLLDPITVLQSVAMDQARILMHTNLLSQIAKGSVHVVADPEAPTPAQPAQPAQPIEAPPWLDNELLGDRQDSALSRTREVLARFEAASTAQEDDTSSTPDPANPAGSSDDQSQAPTDPKQARLLESAREAVPFLQTASAAMEASRESLASGDRDASAQSQREALQALASAIERFADIRKLIELTYADHQQTIIMITPPDQLAALGLAEADAKKLAAMDARERLAFIEQALKHNIERLVRLQGLFDDELASLDAKAQQAAAQAANGANGANAANGAPPDGEPDPQQQQLEAARQTYVRAEELRKQAFDAITQLSLLADSPNARPGEALDIANQAKQHIEELRRLFYSLIEHLKQLIEEQVKTNDQTGSAASAVDSEDIVNLLGPAAEAQREHVDMGQKIADAVAEQADAASQGGAAPAQGGQGQDPAEQAERLAQAADEMRQGVDQMTVAATQMDQDLEAASSMSVDLSPAMEAQRTAIEHLEAALALLQPPQEQPQDQQDQDQQKNQDEQQQKDVDQQQAQRHFQEMRDREDERRRNSAPTKREPVEKDW